jgi:polyisoprenoid-binding protein YceI
MTTLETLLNDPDTAGVWNLIPDQSSVGFKIKNMWGLIGVKGQFTEFNGDGQLTGKGAVFGRLDINVASLRTGIGRRDKHLLSADFFDAERFPQISVVVTALQPKSGPSSGPKNGPKSGKAADLRANFTIKGVTDPVPLPVTITELEDGSVRIAGETQLERAQFDVGWNKFGMVSPTVTVSAQTIFKRAPR